MRGPNYPVKLTGDERQALETMIRKYTEKQNIVLHAKIILMADAGTTFQAIAQTLGIHNSTVTTGTTRWHDTADKPVRERLHDLPRPGAPDTFTPEQLCQIVALACESPQD